MQEAMKLLENPKTGTIIGAGAMTTPFLEHVGSVLSIACAALGGTLSIVVMYIQLKKHAREKNKNELEVELLRKKIEHEDLEITMDSETLRMKK